MSVSRPRSPLLQAAMMPLPGFSEPQRAASSLIDDIKIQGYNDDQYNLRKELSGLVEETRLRMLSRTVRANHAQHNVEQVHAVSESLELQAARSELEHLRKVVKNREALIAEKDRSLQLLSDELQLCQLEIAQLEERNNTLKDDNGVLLQRWLDYMNERARRTSSDSEDP
ncbi:hypothetical protein FRC12_007743 [Ceratobasidium sp. 428]|nr:hypothetical protein FRC12_007743 [Ceratobasidium sp. 428]